MQRLFITLVVCVVLCVICSSRISGAQGKPAAVNGVRLWSKVSGQSVRGQAPVLYLHGGPGYNSYSFEKTIGMRLEKHMQVVYFDQRGSGRSERPANGDYSMGALVEDVEAHRKQLGVP